MNSDIRRFLTGGDRRSQARSRAVLDRVLSGDRGVVAELAASTRDEDWLVSMRALDLLEKVAHVHPDWVAPFKEIFVGDLADSDKWEIRLQVVRALPLFAWTAAERRRAIAILTRDVEYPQIFVRAWALDSLATFALATPRMRRTVQRHLRAFNRSGSKALAARARHIRRRLGAR
ncbi:MAG TPA: hypothetical protein VGY57_03975 [Vicinamibacterales bacterium]|nr:hypothetical protein [Vicinamibacterales bacterium]